MGCYSLVFAAVRWSGDRKLTAGRAKTDRKGTAASLEEKGTGHLLNDRRFQNAADTL